jgi:hypothetical protein
VIPQSLTLSEIQAAFRDLETKLMPWLLAQRNIDLQGRRLIGAGRAVGAFDYVTKFDLEQALAPVSEGVESITGNETALNQIKSVRVGTYAVRGAAVAHPASMYLTSDRDYISFVSDGANWYFNGGVHRAAFADRPTPTSTETNYAFFATDTYQMFYWSGSAWVEEIAPALLKFLGETNSFPALKRSSAILQARLADDSAHTDIEVADEAYNATNWNASLEVPTKNAVRDKIETVTGGEAAALVSDTAYASSWNGVTTIAPSKNAVYDKIETLLGSTAYTPTNVTTDRSYDADATSVAELADVLGTLLADLQGKGILS